MAKVVETATEQGDLNEEDAGERAASPGGTCDEKITPGTHAASPGVEAEAWP